MKRILVRILLILGILPVLFGLFLLWSTIMEYRPADSIIIQDTKKVPALKDSMIYSAMIWNIGYAGLGANMDFFYDGGEKVRDSRRNVSDNVKAISSLIQQNDTIDFILIQEVDISSKRSYGIDEYRRFDSLLADHQGSIGINYKVGFVPVPPLKPLGRVKSGIATFTVFQPQSVIRYAFHGNYSWPTRIFMLKRCYLVNRYTLENGKEFVLVNTHNSAYDDGSLRAAQLKQLEKFAISEFEAGNFVLIGGDWNQSPAEFKPNFRYTFDTVNVSYLPKDFLSGWQQEYTSDCPTNRRITAPYNPDTTPTTVIDFYIASPNIKVLKLRAINLEFRNSDHNPVLLTFILK